MDQQRSPEEQMDEDSENSQLLRLMARHTHLTDLLHAHHVIGTYKFYSAIFVYLCNSAFDGEMISLMPSLCPHTHAYPSLLC